MTDVCVCSPLQHYDKVTKRLTVDENGRGRGYDVLSNASPLLSMCPGERITTHRSSSFVVLDQQGRAFGGVCARPWIGANCRRTS
jgi:hypothetical protein